MKSRNGFTLIELLVVIAIIAVLAAILFPVFAKAGRAVTASNCESNLKQIAHAVKMYLTDWEDTYLMNRHFVPGLKPGLYSHSIILSEPKMDVDGNPIKFQWGFGWVEALYGHIEAISDSDDASSVWRCQAASNDRYGTETAAVSYVFNSCLTDQPEGIIKEASRLMMVREIDRLVHSMCRPVYRNPIDNPDETPKYPFLEKSDQYLGQTQNKLHSNGSHVLFTDGHVKLFAADYFPPQSYYSTPNNWDDDSQQWYNYGPNAQDKPSAYIMSIAITP